MREPTPTLRFDPEAAMIEAAIEDTRRFLGPYVRSEAWQADPPSNELMYDLREKIREVEAMDDLSAEWTKNFVIWKLLEQTKKRRRKPTRFYRDCAIREAAGRLVLQGYEPTRNEATQKDSASSIIWNALRRLGERRLTEKQINSIVLEYGYAGLDPAYGPPAVLKYPPP
jgi:hypothetical protein